jgi:hypothetical protein
MWVAGTVLTMDSTQTSRPGVHIDPDGVEWWTLAAVSSALGCSLRTARRKSTRPGFPATYKYGDGLLRWRADEVRAWREEQRHSPDLPTPTDWTPRRVPATRGRVGARRRA